MFKKWVALLLAVTMLLSLAACGSTKPSETTATTQATETTLPTETEAPTETTTAPAATDFDLFQQVKEAVLAADVLTVNMESSDIRTVGVESYCREDNFTAVYEGLQEQLLTKIEGTLTFMDESYEAEHTYTEAYVEGVTYATFDEAKNREEISSEDYLARQIPLCLFEAENFEKVEAISSGISTLLKFSQPTALETWIAESYDELISAEASAKIEKGMFVEMRYKASFQQGAVLRTVEYKALLAYPTEMTLTAQAPEDGEEYTLLSTITAPRLLEESIFNLYATSAKSTEFMQVLTSQAAGYAAQVVTNAMEYGTDANYKAKIESNITQVTQDGQQSVKTEEIFSDGKYTYYMDGELQDEGTADTETFSEALHDIFTEYLSAGAWLTEVDLEDLGDGYLLEFSSENEDCRDYFKELTMQEIFAENTILDDSASAYEHQVLKGYVGIDKDSLMPTSYSVEFQGSHTIEGTAYLLSQQIYGSFTTPDAEAYKKITGEALPEAEPTEKATPVFYHVTGEAGEEMWLLGTIHIGDEKTGFLPEEVYTAFDASDALAVEFDINKSQRAMEENPEFAQKIAAMMIYMDGTTLADHLDEEIYNAAVKHMKYLGSYSATAELMKASAWEMDISQNKLKGHNSLTASKGMDQRLLDRAEAMDKEILDVESMESQVSMLMGLSDELQEYILASSLATSRREYVEDVEELYELWCQGDEAALRTYLREGTEIPEDPAEAALAQEYIDAISTNRDIAMVETAKDYLNSGKTIFYAVGLAHLLAENGLVDSLRAAGYTVELISYAG